MRWPLCAIVAINVLLCADAGEGPSDKIPELKILDHYVGVWDTQVDRNKGQTTTKWILDGRFIQKTEDLEFGAIRDSVKRMTIITYDVEKKVFRMWEFAGGDGYTAETEGTWDAKARKMTFVSRKSGIVTTTTSDFSEAGVEKLKISIIDAKGKTLEEFTGRSIRKKSRDQPAEADATNEAMKVDSVSITGRTKR